MDIIFIYMITLYGALAVASLCLFLCYVCRWFEPRLLFFAALAHQTYIFKNHAWARLTCVQIGVLLFYLTANAVVVGLGIQNMSELETRSATIALLNLVLVSFAGYAHHFAETGGLSLSMYRFLHYWAGRVTIVEALLHAALVVARRQTLDDLFKSGCIAAGSLLAILLSSLWFPHRLRALFGKLHSVFYISTMVGLLWHVGFFKSTVPSITVGVCCALWLTTQLFRLLSLAVRYYSGGLSKTVDTIWMDEAVTRIQVTGQAVHVFPGCYFYVYFRGPLPLRNLLQGYRMLPIANAEESASGKVSTMDFLMTNEGIHSRSVLGVRKGQDLLLVGPFGKDLRLHRFETVILAARGIGILGILPFALHLAARKHQDSAIRDKASRMSGSEDTVYRDVTRKVDLVWWLDYNDQEKWVMDHFATLQSLDVENKLLVVWCVYPTPRTGPPPFQPNGHWQMLYNFDRTSLSREIKQEATYPGKMVVAACGDQDFVDGVRGATMENVSSKQVIVFEQLDFRPARHSKKIRSRTGVMSISDV